MYDLLHSLVCMKIREKREKHVTAIFSDFHICCSFCQKDSSLFPWLATVVWQTRSDPSNLNSDITDPSIFPLTLQVGLDVPVIWIYDTSRIIGCITV